MTRAMDDNSQTYLAAILQEQKYTNQLLQVQAEKLVSIDKAAARCASVAGVIMGMLVAGLLLALAGTFLLR